MQVEIAPIYHEQADNPGFELGTRLKATIQKTRPGHPDLTQHFHSTPMLPCPGKAGSNSETQGASRFRIIYLYYILIYI